MLANFESAFLRSTQPFWEGEWEYEVEGKRGKGRGRSSIDLMEREVNKEGEGWSERARDGGEGENTIVAQFQHSTP